MSKLDGTKSYWVDSKNIYKAIESLPIQVEKTWERVNLEVGAMKFKKIDKVVVAGMGGSALGARVIGALGAKFVKKPIHIVNEFSLPGFIDRQTLVILVSYSGNTEEVLGMANDAKTSGAEVICLCSGGKLGELADKYEWKKVLTDALINPGGQPRMAVGENVMLLVGVLNKVGAIEIDDSEVKRAVEIMKRQQVLFNKEVKTKENPAKRLAESISDKGVVIFSGEHLKGAAHVFKNQLNENAKQWVLAEYMPELHHHFLEGMKYGGTVKVDSMILLVSSSMYSEELKKRTPVVREICEKQGWKVLDIELEGADEWEQVMELINFGEYVAFYTALCNGVDPGPIPWVDYLKTKIA